MVLAATPAAALRLRRLSGVLELLPVERSNIWMYPRVARLTMRDFHGIYCKIIEEKRTYIRKMYNKKDKLIVKTVKSITPEIRTHV